MRYIVKDENGRVVKIGDKVTNLRGEEGTFEGVSLYRPAPYTCKILVDGFERYHTGYSLTITEE